MVGNPKKGAFNRESAFTPKLEEFALSCVVRALGVPAQGCEQAVEIVKAARKGAFGRVCRFLVRAITPVLFEGLETSISEMLYSAKVVESHLRDLPFLRKQTMNLKSWNNPIFCELKTNKKHTFDTVYLRLAPNMHNGYFCVAQVETGCRPLMPAPSYDSPVSDSFHSFPSSDTLTRIR